MIGVSMRVTPIPREHTNVTDGTAREYVSALELLELLLHHRLRDAECL